MIANIGHRLSRGIIRVRRRKSALEGRQNQVLAFYLLALSLIVVVLAICLLALRDIARTIQSIRFLLHQINVSRYRLVSPSQTDDTN